MALMGFPPRLGGIPSYILTGLKVPYEIPATLSTMLIQVFFTFVCRPSYSFGKDAKISNKSLLKKPYHKCIDSQIKGETAIVPLYFAVFLDKRPVLIRCVHKAHVSFTIVPFG